MLTFSSHPQAPGGGSTVESRTPNLGPSTTKGNYFVGTLIEGSTFWILPGVCVSVRLVAPYIGNWLLAQDPKPYTLNPKSKPQWGRSSVADSEFELYRTTCPPG